MTLSRCGDQGGDSSCSWITLADQLVVEWDKPMHTKTRFIDAFQLVYCREDLCEAGNGT